MKLKRTGSLDTNGALFREPADNSGPSTFHHLLPTTASGAALPDGRSIFYCFPS